MRPHASAEHDGVGRDVTRLGIDTDCASFLDANAEYFGVLEYFGAPHARTTRKSLRGVDGVRLAVLADEDAALEITDLE